jgi:hypothetical protein
MPATFSRTRHDSRETRHDSRETRHDSRELPRSDLGSFPTGTVLMLGTMLKSKASRHIFVQALECSPSRRETENNTVQGYLDM